MKLRLSFFMGLLLIGLAMQMTVDLFQGVSASGINRLVNLFSFSGNVARLISQTLTVVLIMIAYCFGFRALIYKKICLSESCALEN
ncbi:hypothetical protein FLL45_15890 [Aliikangiella marina]|uniref:Uncharacterized protein n=1 Tax=Aliikangiella marina TaxID=1712262 RepID=A0A545T6T9_9GAMM|nr:hypothetical protein [Aliikangiella marina]TQV72944.1 hypothetical protein FLL45_15890 [Aliikangiella marina]